MPRLPPLPRHRRRFGLILLPALVACSLLACLGRVMAGDVALAADAGAPVGKKGVCLTTRSDAWAAKVDALDVSWHYSWAASLPADEPRGVEFVPMIWACHGVTPEFAKRMDALAERKAQGAARCLLGFNEPDGDKQANMTVAQALEAWPALEKTGLRLGSPAAVHGNGKWMQSFMRQAREKNCRVDFVAVHWYGEPNPDALIRELKEVHALYGKPIWITEFAVADWKAKSREDNKHSPEACLRFMRDVLPRLDALDFVERYAWFTTGEKDVHLGPSALFQADGSLTTLGRFYASHKAGAGANRP